MLIDFHPAFSLQLIAHFWLSFIYNVGFLLSLKSRILLDLSSKPSLNWLNRENFIQLINLKILKWIQRAWFLSISWCYDLEIVDHFLPLCSKGGGQWLPWLFASRFRASKKKIGEIQDDKMAHWGWCLLLSSVWNWILLSDWPNSGQVLSLNDP